MGMGRKMMRGGSRRGWGTCRWVVEEEVRGWKDEMPDLDDIPDMEGDDLEEGDGEATAAAPKVSVITTAGVVDGRYVCWVAGNQVEH